MMLLSLSCCLPWVCHIQHSTHLISFVIIIKLICVEKNLERRDIGVFGLNLRLLLISCLANLCASLDNKFYIYVKQKQTQTETESRIGLTICWCLCLSRLQPSLTAAPDNMSFVPKRASVLRFFFCVVLLFYKYIIYPLLLFRFRTICYRICLCLFRMPSGARVLFCFI